MGESKRLNSDVSDLLSSNDLTLGDGVPLFEHDGATANLPFGRSLSLLNPSGRFEIDWLKRLLDEDVAADRILFLTGRTLAGLTLPDDAELIDIAAGMGQWNPVERLATAAFEDQARLLRALSMPLFMMPQVERPYLYRLEERFVFESLAWTLGLEAVGAKRMTSLPEMAERLAALAEQVGRGGAPALHLGMFADVSADCHDPSYVRYMRDVVVAQESHFRRLLNDVRAATQPLTGERLTRVLSPGRETFGGLFGPTPPAGGFRTVVFIIPEPTDWRVRLAATAVGAVAAMVEAGTRAWPWRGLVIAMETVDRVPAVPSLVSAIVCGRAAATSFVLCDRSEDDGMTWLGWADKQILHEVADVRAVSGESDKEIVATFGNHAVSGRLAG